MLRRTHLGFRARLVAAMIALVVLVGLAISALLMVYLFEDENNRALEKLDLGERMADEILKRRTNLIYSRLTIAVKDFGFRSAIASGDHATIDSALENHSRRAGADFALLINNSREILASTLTRKLPELPESLYFDATTKGFGQTFSFINGRGYEVLLVPVKGPGLRAWLISGFALDQQLAEAIATLSGTGIVFRARRADHQNFQIFATTERADAELSKQLARPSPPEVRHYLDNADYFTRIINLGDDDTPTIQAVLLISRAESRSNYYERAGEIAMLIGIILIFAVGLALIIARYLGQPVLRLATYARAIGEGQTPQPPEVRTGGELGQLKEALGDMLISLRERETEIHYAATHDEVTGLNNRSALMSKAHELFTQGESYSLIGLQLNDLANLNDTLGLEFVDKLLAGFSDRLRDQCSGAFIVARTGGGEFLALMPPCSPDTLNNSARQLHRAAERPLYVNNTPFSLRTTMATMRLPDDAPNTEAFRRRINLTFEQARDSSEPIAHYQPGQDENHLRELQLISDLHTAITENGLHMNYQPKLDTTTGDLVQVEALVRWIHPELGFISPEEFIFLAEQSGQIHSLTAHILQRVATDARAWAAKGIDAGVAINLSAMDLAWPELSSHVARTFAGWHHATDRITLEVTEGAIMQDPEEALITLNKLKDLGVTLSIDDFGTGYSSLSQLRKLPVQELKIDKSFVLKLDSEPQDQLIVKSTIDMAHGLGLKVVAEGIENLSAWHLLRQWGCDLGQGFYLSRPVSAADLPDTATRLAAMQQELTNPTSEYSQ